MNANLPSFTLLKTLSSDQVADILSRILSQTILPSTLTEGSLQPFIYPFNFR